MKARLLDISHWIEKPSKQTEGTRDKRVLISPDDGALYYFKTSLKKIKQDYKMEFWSEVIASRIGLWLGFDLVEYNVAILHENGGSLVGCLSRSMYDPNEEEVLSGYNLLVVYEPKFQADFQKLHSLKLIGWALEHHKLEHLFEGVLQCWLFDLIIGNGDRHSENWAVVRKRSAKADENLLQSIRERAEQLRADGITSEQKVNDILEECHALELWSKRHYYRLGQIYDSGSSLGRELTEERLSQMLRDKRMFDAYLNRSKGDISVRHLEHRKYLEDFILFKEDYYDIMAERIASLSTALGNKHKLKDIIYNIDADVRDHIPQEFHLSDERKELIYRLVYERIKRMIN